MIDAVEIINRFTEYSPSKGEEPLPLPIPGHWFRKICALADRIAAAENERDALRERCADLELRLDIGTGNMYDVVVLENEKLQEVNTRLRDALRLAVEQRDAARAENHTHTLTNHLADSMADADRLADLIKHAQRVGAFRGSSFLSQQAIALIDKHNQTTWEAEKPAAKGGEE